MRGTGISNLKQIDSTSYSSQVWNLGPPLNRKSSTSKALGHKLKFAAKDGSGK